MAAALAATTPPSAHIDIFLLAALLLSFAVASRIEFEVGSGFAVPTELVLVPMLFLLPAEIVPLVVAAALVLGQAPDYMLGRAPLERVVVPIGNASFALGPAAVIAAVGVPGPDAARWGLLLAALIAQFALGDHQQAGPAHAGGARHHQHPHHRRREPPHADRRPARGGRRRRPLVS
jgi:hypothetical protein